MRSDQSKTKKELIRELELLRARVNAQEAVGKNKTNTESSLDRGELKILLKAAVELSSTLDLDSVMQAATDHITKLTHIGTAAIYLVENDKVYLGAATPPIDPSMPDEFRWARLNNHPHIKKAVKTKEIVSINDTSQEKLTPEEQLIIDQRNLRSIWYIPVSIASGTIGIFIIASQGKLTTCTNKELELCTALSNLVAVALQNSLLHRKLEEKHEELSTTLLSIGDAVISTDINGNVVLMNHKAENLCGCSFAKAKGKALKKVFRIINSKTRKLVEDPVSKVIKEGKRVSLANHTTLISHDGTEYQIADSAAPIFNKEKEITGVVLVFSDVTKEYALKEALKESQESLIKAEIMGEFGSWELDLTTNKITGSLGAAKIYGVDKKEFDLNHIQKIPLYKYRELLDKALLNLIKRKKPYDLEFEIKRHDGEIRVVHSSAEYDSKRRKVFGVLQDITDRKLAEEALKSSEMRYREFFMKDLTGDFLTSVDGKIVDCNPAFLSMFGFNSLEDIRKIKATTLYIKKEERRKLIKLIKKEGEVKFYELQMLRSDGKVITVMENVIGIFNDQHELTHLRGYIFDITERKKAEEDIIEAKESAESADRMKTEFLAQMSHEIRSPLNAVLSFTSIVKELTSKIDSEDLDICFSGINSASKRIIRTIDSILNMSDLQLGTYKVTRRKMDIVDLLKNLVFEFENLAAENNLELRLKTDVQKKLLSIDDYALSQILVNLVDNAIKYTRKGIVEIKLEVDNEIVIKVKDTGIGISKEYLPRLFTPFTQEEQGYTRSYDGNGLGLALVKKYCDLLNAEIKVKSKKNYGTMFTIILG